MPSPLPSPLSIGGHPLIQKINAMTAEFVVKPVNNKDLLARVKTQISARQWEREIDQTSATIKTP